MSYCLCLQERYPVQLAAFNAIQARGRIFVLSLHLCSPCYF